MKTKTAKWFTKTLIISQIVSVLLIGYLFYLNHKNNQRWEWQLNVDQLIINAISPVSTHTSQSGILDNAA
jgi:hypothetical protein